MSSVDAGLPANRDAPDEGPPRHGGADVRPLRRLGVDGGHRHAGGAGAADHGIVTGFPHWWQVAVYSTGALRAAFRPA
ncbi:hypothetical protein [Lentzea atacamensis]|uniref:hypothetical protein n=1 Tax=Lentzea atacamensis TaxID=531938 RepID=UPI0011B3E63F|nr:hypothetical protein [Lentzea atacamensis]